MSHLRVLWLCPRWSAYSEPWNWRMLDALGREHVVGVASRKPDAPDYHGIPTYDVLGGWSGRVPAALLKRCGFVDGSNAVRNRTANQVLRSAMADCRPNTLFIQFANFALTVEPTLRSWGAPIFIHCHGVDVTWEKFDPPVPAKAEAQYRDYQRRVVGLADFAVFLANSHHTRQRLLDAGVPATRVHTKYLGVAIPEPLKRDTPRDVWNLLYVGRFIDCKGPDLTIRAFEAIANDIPQAHLHMIGEGELWQTCREMADRSPVGDRIHLWGALPYDEVQQWLGKADVVTAHNRPGPTTKQVEAYGVVFVEAMAWELPVVTGASGGPCEIVQDGVTGILFPPGDVVAHATALKRLFHDKTLAGKMGVAGRQRAIAHFSAENEREQLRALLGVGTSPAPPLSS